MRRGSVCVDLAASELGGNVEGSVDGEVVVTKSGVTVVGGGNLASDLAASASQMYARNVGALIQSIVVAGEVAIDLSDELLDAITVSHESYVRTAMVREALGLAPTASTIKETAHS
jgi:NAD(P) transhydrogenase subunit alpha